MLFVTLIRKGFTRQSSAHKPAQPASYTCIFTYGMSRSGDLSHMFDSGLDNLHFYLWYVVLSYQFHSGSGIFTERMLAIPRCTLCTEYAEC